MGARLVIHSFQLLIRNFADALKVSVFPIVVGVLLGIAAFSVSGITPEVIMMASVTGSLPPGGLLALLFVLIMMLFVFSWIAVGWHRFVLLEEYPGYVPAVTGRPIWPYVLRTMGLALLLLLVMAVLSGVLGMVLPVVQGAALHLVSGLLAIVMTYIWLRVALVLPAIAVEQPMRLREAWSASEVLSGPIFGASAILVALNFVVGLAQTYYLPSGFLGQVIGISVTWVTLMVGTSILTTLYGHIVQNRPLP